MTKESSSDSESDGGTTGRNKDHATENAPSSALNGGETEIGDDHEEHESEEDDSTAQEKTTESNQDKRQEIVPELHPDVYQAPFEGFDVSDPEDLADAVRLIDSQAAVTIEELYRRNLQLQEQVEKYKEEAKKAQKKFQQFKERKNNETEEIKETAAKDFIRETLPILDNLDRALDQDADDIRSGVELIREEFVELLQSEGVVVVQPEAGKEVDPSVHEVMSRVEADVESDLIVDCFRPGYVMEDVVVRPARVTVSDGSEGTDPEDTQEDGEEKTAKNGDSEGSGSEEGVDEQEE